MLKLEMQIGEFTEFIPMTDRNTQYLFEKMPNTELQWTFNYYLLGRFTKIIVKYVMRDYDLPFVYLFIKYLPNLMYSKIYEPVIDHQ